MKRPLSPFALVLLPCSVALAAMGESHPKNVLTPERETKILCCGDSSRVESNTRSGTCSAPMSRFQ